jgi:hypothetical protein
MSDTVNDLAECDAILYVYRNKLMNDPSYSDVMAWTMIDRWLDIRLQIMEKNAVQGSQGREEVLSV